MRRIALFAVLGTFASVASAQSGLPDRSIRSVDRSTRPAVLIGGLEGVMYTIGYPEFARQAGVEGTVVVIATISERGIVGDFRVERTPNQLLTEAVVQAAQRARFQPALFGGRAIVSEFRFEVPFILR